MPPEFSLANKELTLTMFIDKLHVRSSQTIAQSRDVRMVADDNLNRVTRSLGDGSVGRLQVELFKEIKKNGSSRCVRAALSRFSALTCHIRPAKCCPYLVNFLPCLAALAR